MPNFLASLYLSLIFLIIQPFDFYIILHAYLAYNIIFVVCVSGIVTGEGKMMNEKHLSKMNVEKKYINMHLCISHSL